MQTILLKDGRQLAYAQYGDPRGIPVFLFHGAPGSRIFRPPLDELTAKTGVRLITVDRPGLGGSDFQPGRRLSDWPADVSALADSLVLQRFAVCGHSAGGPYALACAARIPDRLTAAAAISGLGPVDAPGGLAPLSRTESHRRQSALAGLNGMRPRNRLGFAYGGYFPWPVWRLGIWILFRRGKDHPEEFVHPDAEDPANPDNAMLAMPGGLQVCLDSTREAFRRGVLGHAWDSYLAVHPWDFSLREIRMPVHVWHGLEDRDAPIGMARAVVRKLPDCRAHFLEGESHLLIFKYWEKILSALTTPL
jgi:pimeloyl-ACP methyl ester carboxylesterase